MATVKFEDVTPDKAYDLLARNTNNRQLRARQVEKYARDMKAGEWLEVGEPIEIAADGEVLNGQHRLMAVIEADKTVRLAITRGLDKKAQRVADQGVKRTFADVLRMQYGQTDANRLAAAVRLMYHYRETGILGVTGSDPAANPSIAELARTYEQEKGLADYVQITGALRNYGVMTSAGVTCALGYLFDIIDPEEAPAFWARLKTGANLGERDPILSLRRTLSGDDRPRTPKGQAGLIIKAFNYWREGREVQSLRFRAGGSKPDPFPTINPAQ